MDIVILGEYGYDFALLGLSLSHKQMVDRMPGVAEELLVHDDDSGHLKFLESIVVYLDIDAPRYWWQQFDTYRAGVTKQSESTMHTLMKGPLTQMDFQGKVLSSVLVALNGAVDREDFDLAKSFLPESFLQRRIVCTNYKALRHMYKQRRRHRLREWRLFCDTLVCELEHPEFVGDE